MLPWPDISEQISATTSGPFMVKNASSIGGGCINQGWLIEGRAGNIGQRYFVKLNHSDNLGMFEAEAAGLDEIHRTQTLRTPKPICFGSNATHAWLVMEYVELGGGDKNSAALMGRQLAAMHRSTAAQFGWWRDNTIGATPQINTQSDNWINFWREQRLGYQLRLARDNGYGGSLQIQGDRLLMRLDAFFGDYSPAASLLHGDLWSGNYGYDALGQPLVFDPAVYYGDRETDLAMTELFGGFSAGFHAAYREVWPLDPGYATRKTLYNLYHILNHLNLFGGGYLHQAKQMMSRLLAEVG